MDHDDNSTEKKSCTTDGQGGNSTDGQGKEGSSSPAKDNDGNGNQDDDAAAGGVSGDDEDEAGYDSDSSVGIFKVKHPLSNGAKKADDPMFAWTYGTQHYATSTKKEAKEMRSIFRSKFCPPFGDIRTCHKCKRDFRSTLEFVLHTTQKECRPPVPLVDKWSPLCSIIHFITPKSAKLFRDMDALDTDQLFKTRRDLLDDVCPVDITNRRHGALQKRKSQEEDWISSKKGMSIIDYAARVELAREHPISENKIAPPEVQSCAPFFAAVPFLKPPHEWPPVCIDAIIEKKPYWARKHLSQTNQEVKKVPLLAHDEN